jgi:RimJ/RimL family protein N-acetyltransferase
MNRVTENETERISIQIYLDRSEQKRGIGRVAYRLACEESGYDTVYADMAKKNIASRRAAEAAGFVVVPSTGKQQMRMVWRRQNEQQ